MAERLQKIISQWGIASRRQAEQMILDGRVRLNGEVVQLGQKANPAQDQIEVDGKQIQPINRPEPVYVLLHKPAEVVSTCDDPWGRRTVLDLLPDAMRQSGIHPVGRLDAASTGALLLTNEGDVTFSLTHPRHAIAKTYEVWVKGHPTAAALQQWRQGIMLAGKQTLPADVEVMDRHHTSQTLLRIVLREGRNRQIRRVAEQLGYPVLKLHRVAIGPIQLGDLASGEFRFLTRAEIKFLRTLTPSTERPLPHIG